MDRTPEQQAIIDHVTTTDGLTMVSAVAGSGKTTLLVEIAKELKPQSALYLAYNKAVATEAQRKFPKTVKCCTTHSLAYRPTVIDNKLSLGFFSYRDIKDKIKYEEKCAIVEAIREFCLSSHTKFKKFAEEIDLEPHLQPLGQKYLNLMQQGTVQCTHDFYLKMFHLLLLNGNVDYEEFDFIALDEAGDLNPVTLEIFKLLPAKKKLMVGDPHQNIYTSNHTINCFSVMEGEGAMLPMSQSFRVDTAIAQKIETFTQSYLDPTMQFKGVPLLDKSIKTKAFISRTNASLVGKMIELNDLGIQYGLTRTAKQLFTLPLTLCGLKKGGFIANPEYKHLQADVEYYFKHSDIRQSYKSPLAYIRALYNDDQALQTIVGLIARHSPAKIIECYHEARKHEKKNQNYMLGTSHSTKGLEFDQVELADDLNTAISPILQAMHNGLEPEKMPSNYRTELNLYYVACSRAKKSLINATHLDTGQQSYLAINKFNKFEFTNPNL